MTNKQESVFNYIRDGKFISYRQTALDLGFKSLSSVVVICKRLLVLGLIRKQSVSPFAITETLQTNLESVPNTTADILPVA